MAGWRQQWWWSTRWAGWACGGKKGWHSILHSSCSLLAMDQFSVDGGQQQGGEQQHRTQRRGQAPVDRFGCVEGDEVADHLIGGAADECRRDVVAERQDEDEQTSRPDARQRLRQVDPQEGGDGRRPERRGGTPVSRRDRLPAALQRPDPKRQAN